MTDRKAALDAYEQAVAIDPIHAEAQNNVGAIYSEQGRLDEARATWGNPTLLRRSLQLRTDYPEALIGLGRALQSLDQLDAARRLIQRATDVVPERADAWCQLGAVAMEMGDTADAEAAYRQALSLDSQLADALTGLGNLRIEEGQIDEAERLLRSAINIAPDNLGARFQLIQTRKVKVGDDNLALLETLQQDVRDFSTCSQISYHYTMGKAYDDLKDYDKAFAHFIEGSRLKRAKLHYDYGIEASRVQCIAEMVDRSVIDRLRGAGDPSDVPVFVLGMPRSGTTLTEQIVASHPAVHGAGELRELMQIVQQPTVLGSVQPYPNNLAGLTADAATAWGREYVERLRTRFPAARRITDKMPANYLALGLISLILPNAKIIHVKRNSVDTCVSCFTRLFNKHQDATYDLYELGRHYANYARLMNHWRAVLPALTFLEVQYEDIIADMEGQARRLIDYVGLDWDDKCLAFHKTKRNIRTASVTQVRQPIYTSSVERWRNYEKYLGPLIEGLGEFAP